MTDTAPFTSPVHCTEVDCPWAVFGIPTAYTEARTRRLAEHMAEEHAPKPETTSVTDQGPSERLAEIEARTQGATDGPWASDGAEIYRTFDGTISIDDWVGETLDIENDETSKANAAFMAQARTDVPWLVQRVRDLEAELLAARSAA